MDRLKTYVDRPFFRYLLFWVIVFLFYAVTNWEFFSGPREVIDTYGIKVGLQFITAIVCMHVLMPRFFNRENKVVFVVLLLGLMVVIVSLYLSARIYYLEVVCPKSYTAFFENCEDPSFFGRLLNPSAFLGKSIFFLTPTFLLVATKFYREQQRLSKINEQKKTAELTALKNQLNPHFLFNTLNNLYALAIEKSDRTPEVIERLSDMLDYMLYRCKDDFVILQKEIEFIDNYLALEKIRYGQRVTIVCNNQVTKAVKIAPLILLTFIENAFKHGVSQELKNAKIDIALVLQDQGILFSVCNTKPDVSSSQQSRKTEALGLKNVKKQLELLYPEEYSLEIKDEEDRYSVNLLLSLY